MKQNRTKGQTYKKSQNIRNQNVILNKLIPKKAPHFNTGRKLEELTQEGFPRLSIFILA